MGAETSIVIALFFLWFLIMGTVIYLSVDYSQNLVKKAQNDQDTMRKAKMQTDITITNVSFSNYSGNVYLNITLKNTGMTTLNASLLNVFINGIYIDSSYCLKTTINTLVPKNSTNISIFSIPGNITIDNTGAQAFSSSTKVLNIASFAVGSGSNRLLVVGLNYYQNPGYTTVKYNNINLTLIKAYNNSNLYYAELWYLINPPTGSFTISHTQTTATQVVMGAWSYMGANSYTGVDQINPIGAIANATGNSNNSSVSITTTVANSWLTDTETDTAPSHTFGAGQTQRYNYTLLPNINGGGSDKATTAVGSYTMNWMLSNSVLWVGIAAEIKPYMCNTPTSGRIKVVTENGIWDYAIAS